MRGSLLLSLALAATVAPVSAQQRAPLKLADVAGAWDSKVMIGPKGDSVVATYTLTATADAKTWTLKFAGREALPVRITAQGGDSVVSEVGPYSSVLRAGVMVTTQTTSHFNGNAMTGTFRGVYSTGDTLRGKISGARKAK